MLTIQTVNTRTAEWIHPLQRDRTDPWKIRSSEEFPQRASSEVVPACTLTERTEYVVTNDLTQDSTGETQKHAKSSIRWKIEQFHRQAKQVTGLESCQCRKQRAVRNHIGCAMLVWVKLNRVARQRGKTIYQLKQSLLDDYLSQQLLSPSIPMALA